MGLEAAAFAATSLIGTGISAYGQYKAGQEQKQAYEYNAALSRQRAQAVAQEEAMSEYKKAQKDQEKIGSQMAATVAGGVKAMSGSPLDVMTNSLANANLDIQIMRYNSQVAQMGLESEAQQEEEAGKAAAEGGALKAGLTLFKGIGESPLLSFGGTNSSGGDEIQSGDYLSEDWE